MTNPYIAGAAAERYLADLFGQHFQGGPEAVQKELAQHVIDNARRGEDGYPVLKIVGKNRLVIEFDLGVPPTGPKAVAQAKRLDEISPPPADPGPESPAHSDGYVLPGKADDVVDAEILEDDRPMDPSHPDWPNRPLRHEGDEAPAEDLPHDQGYRSPWAEKGDAARAKRELPADPTEADLPAPLDQEYTTAQDAVGSSS